MCAAGHADLFRKSALILTVTLTCKLYITSLRMHINQSVHRGSAAWSLSLGLKGLWYSTIRRRGRATSPSGLIKRSVNFAISDIQVNLGCPVCLRYCAAGITFLAQILKWKKGKYSLSGAAEWIIEQMADFSCQDTSTDFSSFLYLDLPQTASLSDQ